VSFDINAPTNWGVGRVTVIRGNTVSFGKVTASEQPFDVPPKSGGRARWRGDVLHDVEIRRNTLVKTDNFVTVDKQGYRIGTPKNWVEFKAGRHIVVDGNRMTSNPPTNVALTVWNQNGSSPWIELNDVQFTNNWLTNFSAPAFGIVCRGYSKVTGLSGNFTIANNLLDGASNGSVAVFNSGYNIHFRHNTILNGYDILYVSGEPVVDSQFVDNIVRQGSYGVHCADPPGPNLKVCFPGFTMNGNVIVDGQGNNYPGTNYFPANDQQIRFVDAANGNYRLAPNSPYRGKATDGTDPGCNIDKLLAAIGGAATPATHTRRPIP
jgi:hypothetical protein